MSTPPPPLSVTPNLPGTSDENGFVLCMSFDGIVLHYRIKQSIQKDGKVGFGIFGRPIPFPSLQDLAKHFATSKSELPCQLVFLKPGMTKPLRQVGTATQVSLSGCTQHCCFSLPPPPTLFRRLARSYKGTVIEITSEVFTQYFYMHGCAWVGGGHHRKWHSHGSVELHPARNKSKVSQRSKESALIQQQTPLRKSGLNATAPTMPATSHGTDDFDDEHTYAAPVHNRTSGRRPNAKSGRGSAHAAASNSAKNDASSTAFASPPVSRHTKPGSIRTGSSTPPAPHHTNSQSITTSEESSAPPAPRHTKPRSHTTSEGSSTPPAPRYTKPRSNSTVTAATTPPVPRHTKPRSSTTSEGSRDHAHSVYSEQRFDDQFDQANTLVPERKNQSLESGNKKVRSQSFAPVVSAPPTGTSLSPAHQTRLQRQAATSSPAPVSFRTSEQLHNPAVHMPGRGQAQSSVEPRSVDAMPASSATPRSQEVQAVSTTATACTAGDDSSAGSRAGARPSRDGALVVKRVPNPMYEDSATHFGSPPPTDSADYASPMPSFGRHDDVPPSAERTSRRLSASSVSRRVACLVDFDNEYPSQKMERETISNFVYCTMFAERRSGQLVCSNVRQFVNGFRNFIMIRHGERIQAVIPSDLTDPNDSETAVDVAGIIEASLQSCVVSALQDHIMSIFLHELTDEHGDASLETQMRMICSLPLVELGFEPSLASLVPTLDFTEALWALVEMSRVGSALMKLKLLQQSVRAMHEACSAGGTYAVNILARNVWSRLEWSGLCLARDRVFHYLARGAQLLAKLCQTCLLSMSHTP